MGRSELLSRIRKLASGHLWSSAVEMTRTGVIRAEHDDGDEIQYLVKPRGRAEPFEVFLWPEDEDDAWDCTCGATGPVCVHVAAASIVLGQAGSKPVAEEQATVTKIRLRYAFTRSTKNRLSLERQVVWPSGKMSPLSGTLSNADLIATRGDVQAESLLVREQRGPLRPEVLRRLIVFLEGEAEATLDTQPVSLNPKPMYFPVKVEDAKNDGFRVRLARPSGVEELFHGAVLVDGALRPTSYGELTSRQRTLLMSGVEFGADEVGRLISDFLPKMREKIPVSIATKRLPDADALAPRVQLGLSEKAGGLEVHAELVYGDPPVAKITPGGTLQRLTDAVVPARDPAAERSVVREFETAIGLAVGFRHMLPPEDAAKFLSTQLDRHKGRVVGKVDPDRFKIIEVPLAPMLQVERAEFDSHDEEDYGWSLDVGFRAGEFEADPDMVLHAWRTGRSLVPLLDGGYAPLPRDWFRQHGPLLRELMEARDSQGKVGRNATAALVELMEDTKGEVPPDLKKLRAFLEGEDGLPDLGVPESLNAELRPYQVVGFRWLAFLRNMSLNGILADDMGLGKTLQAIAALTSAGGRSLVVAPTSVLRNWESEIHRFAPSLSVNVYHGPKRSLDNSDVTLTSYALMRMDLQRLREQTWTYVVLDEAQAIKNPQSQTARSARALRSTHRLALTGTPVENRLEELWSLFQFLMPGLLGSMEAFRDRFVRPIENGDSKARVALRSRVRPYVMRRMKQQVAQELPSLTEMVIRCEMTAEQRKVYDAVRLAVRRDVQEALAERGRSANMKVLEALLRMRQACCDPSLLPGDTGANAPSTKLDRMEELLVDLVCDDHKALIFSQWTSMLDRCQSRLEKLGIDYVRLDGSTRDRQAVIDSFQREGGPPVFLLSLKAGGTGLNLTAADYVLHLDPWWNPAVEQQATDRAHRIGQTRPVVSCRLIAAGTVEERILDLQKSKRELADAALGGDGGLLRSLSAAELRSLFESV